MVNKTHSKLIEEMPPKVLHAYQIYMTNHSVTETAKQVGVDRSTIYRWKKRYKWDELEKQKLEEIMADIEEYKAKIKEEQRGILDKAIEIAVQQLREGKLKVRSMSDLVALLRYQLELEGEFRDDNNINVNVGLSIASLHEELMKRRGITQLEGEDSN
ncbi:helix-turn-helix domain-containing protein [Palaeococcus sp. (in: euryarchaeotes)]